MRMRGADDGRDDTEYAHTGVAGRGVGGMSDVYDAVKEHFDQVEDVEVNSGRGAQGMKHGGKMITMFYKGDLVVKLAPERVSEIVAAGEGEPFDPGTGKPMADRALVRASRKDSWVALCEESAEHARAGG